MLTEHVAAELVKEQNRSQSSISIEWPARILPCDVILIVREEVFTNLLVQLGRVLDIKPAAPEDLVVGAGDAIPVLWVPKVEDCIDSCALLRGDRFRRSTERAAHFLLILIKCNKLRLFDKFLIS